jgi:hypothetical protein
MPRYTPLGPDAEVLGGAISGFVQAVNRDAILPHLKKVGLNNIEPDKWYPKQQYLDLYNSIEEANEAAMFDFVSIGMTIAQTAWPPEMDELPFEEIVRGWGERFDAVNRGADRGYIRVEQVEERHWKIIKCLPDPDDLNYGVVYGVCKRFLPPGTRFSVTYDPEVARRDTGGEETIFHIRWE